LTTKPLISSLPPAAIPAATRDMIVVSLEDDKAEDTVVIDLQGRTSLADYLVISTGRSARQVGAMADHIMEELKNAGLGRIEAEGMPQNDWVLIDGGDVIVHLFRPEVRAFYAIEKMWGLEAPQLPPGYDGPSLTGAGDDGFDDEDLDGDELDDVELDGDEPVDGDGDSDGNGESDEPDDGDAV
jgi:ribosome-associated protein